MNRNKLLSDIRTIIRRGSPKKQLLVIYSIAVPLILLFMWGTNVTSCTDTASYLDPGASVTGGNIDYLRTPLYPLICYLLNSLTGHSSDYFPITWIQQIVFLLSVTAFYQTAKILFHPGRVIFYITLFYACYPGITLWNQCILSESFAISGMVFFLYSVTLFTRKPTLKTAILTNLILLLLVMLRPGFIYLIPIAILFWTMLFFRNKGKAAIAGLAGVLIVTALFLGYCSAFRKQYGLFAPSAVSLINQYFILRQAKLFRIDEINTDNESLKKDLSRTLPYDDFDTYDGELIPLARRYGFPALNILIKNTIHKHSEEYLMLTAQRFHQVNSMKIFNNYAVFRSTPVKAFAYGIIFLFNITFRIVYFFLIGYGIYLICYSLNKRKPLPVLSWLMWMAASAHIFSIIAGAHSEWARLALPGIPVLLMMFGQLASQFRLSRKNEILLE